MLTKRKLSYYIKLRIISWHGTQVYSHRNITAHLFFNLELMRNSHHLWRSWPLAGKWMPIFYGQGEQSWIRIASRAWHNMHTYAHPPTAVFHVQCRTHSLSYMGETHTVIIGSCRDCEQSQPIRQRLSRVLLPPRMSNRGPGQVLVFVLALAFSTYAALGILKKMCPVPSSALPPLCSTSLTGQSENETHTNTPLLAMKYVLATASINKTVLLVSW